MGCGIPTLSSEVVDGLIFLEAVPINVKLKGAPCGREGSKELF
jgi:hypothetical protein